MTEKTPNTYVAQVDPALANKLKDDLISQGFTLSTPEHTFFAGRKPGLSCTFYKSGRLVLQGKNIGPFIEFYLEPELLQSVDFTYRELKIDRTARIGIDESGKGDLFGPLCVAGVYAEGDLIIKLQQIGVKDSKDLTDTSIHKIAKEIRSICPYVIVKMNPERYNALYEQFKNLNHLLAWGHSAAIERLVEKTQCRNVIIDQFAAEHTVERALANKKLVVNLKQRHRAEEDLVVAAASILARDAFVEGLEKLGKEIGCKLPKGASSKVIETGRKLLREHGPEVLPKVCKMHFKSIARILSG